MQLPEVPGKPRLAGDAGPCFSLARSGDLAVVAVARFEVGVDVEGLDREVDDLIGVACTEAEAAHVRRLPAGRRGDALLRLWTAKEAYVKATGAGLAVAPASVEVGIGEGGTAPVRVLGQAEDPRWWVREFRPQPGFVGAVCAEGQAWGIALRHTRA